MGTAQKFLRDPSPTRAGETPLPLVCHAAHTPFPHARGGDTLGDGEVASIDATSQKALQARTALSPTRTGGTLHRPATAHAYCCLPQHVYPLSLTTPTPIANIDTL